MFRSLELVVVKLQEMEGDRRGKSFWREGYRTVYFLVASVHMYFEYE